MIYKIFLIFWRNVKEYFYYGRVGKGFFLEGYKNINKREIFINDYFKLKKKDFCKLKILYKVIIKFYCIYKSN